MVAKKVLVLLVQAFFIQNISCQCIGAYNGYAEPWGAAPYAYAPYEVAAPYTIAPYEIAAPYAPCAEWSVGYNPAALAASHGPGLAVTSGSPVAPTGITAVSETAYNGGLAVTGAVPFLSAVALEGTLPTIGAGAISYGCGNGNVAVLEEAPAAYGYGPYEYAAAPYELAAYGAPYGYGLAAAPAYGYGAGYGCGCGAIY